MNSITMFGLVGAKISEDFTVSFPDTPFPDEELLADNAELRNMRTVLSSALGIAACDICGRRLEFPVHRGTEIRFPRRPLGWLFEWDRSKTKLIVVCSTHLRKLQ